MVKLQASVLTLALAASSALASSDEYRQRSLYGREVSDDLRAQAAHHAAVSNVVNNRLQSREFEDGEELFGRQPEPIRAVRFGFAMAHRFSQAQDFADNIQSRGFEDDEGLFGRHLNTEELFGREYDLDAREPLSLSAVGRVARLAEHARQAHGDNAMKIGRHVAHAADRASQVQDFVSNFQSRGFEGDEELLERADEFFGREYDLEAREPLSLSAVGRVARLAEHARQAHGDNAMKIGRHVAHAADRASQVQDFVSNFQSRGFEGDEELLERADEFFGREYDLEAREPLSLSAVGRVARLAEHARQAHGDNAMKIGRHVAHAADRASQVQDFVSNFQSRGFEGDEELLERADEFFGREYGLVDDLD